MTNSPPMPAQLGRYRILKQLGQGGMGCVYLAEDTLLSRWVAVKVPLLSHGDGDALLERFFREARSAAAIKHPNICPILDISEANGVPFLVMEFIEGRPLSELGTAGQAWPTAEAVSLVSKLALTVSSLHERGLVHRDLKPSNVMLRPDGEPILMDFGLARSFTANGRLLTANGEVVGTPAYMAPEQVLAENEAIGPGTDVYALGVILYQLLTGTLPFDGPPMALFGQILHADPAPPSRRRPDLDTRLDTVCLKALAKAPRERYAGMAELAEALKPWTIAKLTNLTEVAVAAPASDFGDTLGTGEKTPRSFGTPQSHRRLWPWVAAGLLFLAALLWSCLAFWPPASGRSRERLEVASPAQNDRGNRSRRPNEGKEQREKVLPAQLRKQEDRPPVQPEQGAKGDAIAGIRGVAGSSPEIKDEAKFFSAEAIAKANTAIKEIKEQTARDLLIETFPEIPEGRKKDFNPDKRDEFFTKWATDNARERKVVGIYVLICKDPARVQVEAGKQTPQRSFPPADRMKLRELLITNLKAEKFDEGLSEAVAYVAKTLKANVEIKDEGGFFSPEAVKKAIHEIVGIEQRYGKELVVETVKEIPADLKKDYTPAKRQEFFYKWARERAQAGMVNGVYVLVCKDPAHLQVEVGNETQKKAFTIKDRDEMAQMLLKQFREKKFDDGLAEAVKFFETTLKANLGEKGS